jgi:hypothetical protein
MILRTELRRSTAPVAGIGFLVVSIGLLYSLPGPWLKGSAAWNEQWTGLAQWTRYLSLFLWPLVLSVGAWQGIRDHRSRVGELFSTTPRPAWRRVLTTAAALAIALTAAYVALLVVGGVQVAGTANYFHLKWLPVVGVMVLGLVASAWAGAGIGRLLPSLVTPPVLAVAALAAQIAATQSAWLLLTPAFEAVHISVFTTVSASVNLMQALWFLGIGATGFGLLVAATAKARAAAVLPLVVAGAVAVPVLHGTTDPVVPDTAATALVCDEHGPKVCVTRAHADYLPLLTGPAREALAVLKKLPSPPTSVVEMDSPDPSRATYRSTSGRVVVHLDPRPVPSRDTLWWAVLVGSTTSACDLTDEDLVTNLVAGQIIVTSWLRGEPAPAPGPNGDFSWDYERPDVKEGWAVLTALPPDEQVARVAAIRQAALDCRDFDLGTP